MEKKAVEEKVRDVVARELGVKNDAIELEKSFIDDLGADSLDIVKLLMELEDAFDLPISEDDAESIRTVGDAVSYIHAHM